MAVTEIEAGGKAPTDVIVSKNPATGEVVGEVPIQSAEEVDAAVARAHEAFKTWGHLSFSERARRLAAFRRAIVTRADEMADIIHRENGKPRLDALQEVMLAVSHLAWAEKNAEKALSTRKVSPGLFANFRATISYHPIGVVGVIGPWNYPLFTPMGSIGYALAAGNAVVFKPSELTPLVARLLEEIWTSSVDLADVFQVVTGDGRTGAALAEAKVGKIAFTGSAATGKKVMASAAKNLTPVLMELGGKDPLIVCDDADIDKAAAAAVYGSMTNTGQACISVERAYVTDRLHDAFVDKVVAEARKVTQGDPDSDIGAMTSQTQVEIVKDHLEDAVAKGAKVLVGGADKIQGRYIPPTVVVDVDESMKLMTEETFGPVLPIQKVHSVEDAVNKANATSFGLGSSIFGKAGVRELASRIKAGMTSINAVIAFAGISSLPFGGVGESGFGRIHGEEGLREFTRVKATADEKFALPVDLMAFGQPKGSYERMRGLMEQVYGGGVVDKAQELLKKLLG